MEKKIGTVLEKLGFMETHFIDVREELSKKFDAKYSELSTVINIMKHDMGDYTDGRIEQLDYGLAQRNLVNRLTVEWPEHE